MFLFGGLDYGDFLEVLPATSSKTGLRDNERNKKNAVLICFVLGSSRCLSCFRGFKVK